MTRTQVLAAVEKARAELSGTACCGPQFAVTVEALIRAVLAEHEMERKREQEILAESRQAAT